MDVMLMESLVHQLVSIHTPQITPALYLESHNFEQIIGCDSEFINQTLTKDGMKQIFISNNVSSPPGFGITDLSQLLPTLKAQHQEMTFPLFVKISDSYGSVGLDDASVCHNEDQLVAKCTALFKKFPGLTIEEFIQGPEYSVLVSGNCRGSTSTIIVYPPSGSLYICSFYSRKKF